MGPHRLPNAWVDGIWPISLLKVVYYGSPIPNSPIGVPINLSAGGRRARENGAKKSARDVSARAYLAIVLRS